MSILSTPFRVRGRAAQSQRGESRALKIPVLSKLRIGGSVGKAAEKVKSTLNNTKVLGIPLGAGIGAATGGLGGLAAAESSRAGGDLGQALHNTGQDLVQGAKNLPLALGLSHAGGAGGAGGLGNAAAMAAGALGGGNGGGGSGGGLGNLLDLGLGGLSAYNAAQLGQKSEKYATDANDMAQANWKSREPLRLAGVQGMLAPRPSSDLSGLSDIASRNPFAAKPKPPLLMGGGQT